MNTFASLLSLLMLSTISTVAGQLTVQSDWVFPQSPDYSTIVSMGSTVFFKWTSNLKNQFSAYLPNGNVSHVDVWVTGANNSKGYHHKLAADFDVSSTQAFQWTVMVPSTELEDESDWVLRFLALDDDPANITYQVSSPLFQIVDDTKSAMASSSSSALSSTSSTSSSSSSSSAISSTSASSTTSAASSTSASSTTSQMTQTNATMTSTFPTTTTLPKPSTTSAPEITPTSTSSPLHPAETTPPTSPSTKALSTGAKAGIAIGISAAAISVCGLLLCLYSQRRRSRNMRSHGRVRMTDADSLPPMEIQPDVSYASKGKL